MVVTSTWLGYTSICPPHDRDGGQDQAELPAQGPERLEPQVQV